MNKEEFRKAKIGDYYKQKYRQKKKQEKILSEAGRFHKNNFAEDRQVSHYIEKRNEDVIFQIIDNLSTRATSVLKSKGLTRSLSHLQLIGCKPDELRAHLENKFKNNMAFANYGEWEVDHVKPVSKFDLDKEEELLECFNYKNLQPLWQNENRSKGNKYLE